eukprot:430336_1
MKNAENFEINTLTLDQWSQQNPFMKDLMIRDKTKAIKLRTAMKTYCNRLLPRLQSTSPTKINDNITHIVDYVSGVLGFIIAILQRRSAPFSMDLIFAVRDVIDAINTIGDSDVDSEDEDEHDSEDDSDADDDDACDSKYNDLIGDFKQRLHNNKLRYHSREQNKHITDPNGLGRFIYEQFRDFDRIVCGDYSLFPRNTRFGLFIDRRGRSDKQKNEMIFFQQLDECDSIPTDHVEEYHIQSLRTCLIPGTDHDDEKSQRKHHRIRAQDHLNGQLLTFNFNVEAADAVKCYIIWNGQTMRLTEGNLVKVLSRLFVESESSIEIQESKLRKAFEIDIVDIAFENFYAQIQRGYEHQLHHGYRHGQKSFRPKAQPAKLLQLRVYQSKTSALSTSDEILDAYLYAKEHQLYTHDEKTEAPNDDLCLYGFSYVDQPALFCEASHPSLKEELLQNKIYPIAKELWNAMYEKAKDLCRDIHTHLGQNRDQNGDTTTAFAHYIPNLNEHYEIQYNTKISPAHLLSLLLCMDKKQTTDESELLLKIQSVKTNSNMLYTAFSHWFKLLAEAVIFYGNHLSRSDAVYKHLKDRSHFDQCALYCNVPLMCQTQMPRDTGTALELGASPSATQ